jgi:hypothetical protein
MTKGDSDSDQIEAGREAWQLALGRRSAGQEAAPDLRAGCS